MSSADFQARNHPHERLVGVAVLQAGEEELPGRLDGVVDELELAAGNISR